MVKVGDTVKLVEKSRGWCCARNLGRNGIVDSVSGNYARVTFEGDDIPYKIDSGNIDALKVISSTPPSKITQNGYEYSLVGPVKPEWLVNGAWVVAKEHGNLWQIIEGEKGNFSLRDSMGNLHEKEISTIVDYYRPHTASDWKWGDWAMYDGKRVFVMTGVDQYGHISVSHPNIYPLGCDQAQRNFLCAPSGSLTPTF